MTTLYNIAMIYVAAVRLRAIYVPLCCCLFALWPVVSAALSDSQRERMAERLAPVGALCVDGDACASQRVLVSRAPRSGADVYQMSCAACHGAGVSGAPRLSTRGDWTARLARGQDTLYDHAIEGFNAMPARGACPNCTDEEIRAAVDYMLDSLPAR